MVELFIMCMILGGFGAVCTVYAAVMVFYFKVIKKSPKSVWQIMGEI